MDTGIGVRERLDAWLGRLSGMYGLWPLVPAAVAAVIGILSTSVAWISQFGWFGWIASGLCGYTLASIGLAANARGKLWRIESARAALIEGNGSAFDPMARVYEGKRLYLRDLAPLGRRSVVGKKFVNCEIIGPGTVVLGLRSNETKPWPEMKDCSTFDVDAVEIENTRLSHLAIEFMDCDFDSCRFYHMTALFWERKNESLTWITKRATPLLEDHSDDRTV